jgi:hypothetical protein
MFGSAGEQTRKVSMAKPFPPVVDGPVFTTSTQVYVDNVLPNAVVTVYDNLAGTGPPIGTATSTNPGGLWVPLTMPTHLAPSQQITARQSYPAKSTIINSSIKVSGLSDPTNKAMAIPVQNVPDPLPAPIFVSGLCTCMDSVYIGGLIPGATLKITLAVTSGGTTTVHTMVDAPVTQSPQWFQLASIPIPVNSVLMATQTIPAKPPSPTTPSQKIPVAGPLQPPHIAEPLFCGQTNLNVSNLIPGADLEVVNGGNESFITNPWSEYDLGPVPPLETTSQVEAHQYFTRCGADGGPQGITGPTAKFSVSKPVLKAPGVTTPCTDVTELAVSDLIPGEILTVNLGGALLGQQGVSKNSATINLPQGWYTRPGPVSLQVEVTLCGIGPLSTEVSVKQLGPYPKPSVQAPLYSCATSVEVLGAHPGTVIQVFNGSTSSPRSNPVVAVTTNFPIELWWPLTFPESIFVTQTGCGADEQSMPSIMVDPTRALQMPEVAGSSLAGDPSVLVNYVLAGAKTVFVKNVVPGAQVTLLVDGEPRIGVDSIQAEVSRPAGTPPLIEVALPAGLPVLAKDNNLTAVQALCGKIGIASPGQGGGVTVVAPVQAPSAGPGVPGGALGSNNNYIMFSPNGSGGCDNLLDVSVTITVQKEIAWKSTSTVGTTCTPPDPIPGFSFQLNCYSPQGSSAGYQQFVVALFGPNPVIKNTTNEFTCGALIFPPDSGHPSWPSSPSFPVLAGSLPGVNIPENYQIKITLQTDTTTGNVTQATFAVLDSLGNPLGMSPYSIPIAAAFQAPIIAIELNLVGPLCTQAATLSSGAGYFTYSAKSALTVSNQQPTCSAEFPYPNFGFTDETANTTYGVLPAHPGNPFTQSFTVTGA